MTDSRRLVYKDMPSPVGVIRLVTTNAALAAIF